MYVSEGKGKYDEEVLNIDYLKELLSPLSSNFENDWYNSFIKQVNTIRKFLERFRIGGKDHINPLDYKLERYGYSDESYDFKVANAYKKFIETYCKSFNANKDNLEPSDVICFNVKTSTKQEFIDNIKTELAVFQKINMCGFMLFMSDLIIWCHENNIPTGFARGSCGGSCIAYVLDIIDINPNRLFLLSSLLYFLQQKAQNAPFMLPASRDRYLRLFW